MKSKVSKIALAMLVVLSVILPHATTGASAAAKYPDVSSTNVHSSSIMELSERGILKGFPDGSFQPEKAVTRGQAAKILALSLQLKIKDVKNPGFSDVTEKNEYYPYIAALAEHKILSGKEDGTFRPGESLSRAQMAKIISLSFHLPVQQLKDNPFKDVDVTHTWYTQYLHGLIVNKITTGTTPQTYSPSDAVRRGQLASFVVRAEKAVQKPVVEEPPIQTPPVFQPPVISPPVLSPPVTDSPVEEPEETPEESTDLPEGLVIHEDIAEVSSNDALIFALYSMEEITSIHLTGGFVLEKEMSIEKDLVIPEQVRDQTFDFHGSSVSSLEVNGDNNTIKNLNIQYFFVSAEVYDLEFVNVTDTPSSTHLIEGGGNESIKLSTGTVFKGEIKISSAHEVQIRATEGSNAKIEGTVLIEGNSPTKISAPVKNVVINTSQPVVLNSTIDNLISRSNGTIKVAAGITPPTIQTRIGVTMSVTDEAGTVLDNVIIEEILDKSELEWLIALAKGIHSNAGTDGYEGDYTQESKDILEGEWLESEAILNANTEVTSDVQLLIDTTAQNLNKSISTFNASAIRVDKTAYYEKWKEAERVLDRIAASGTEQLYAHGPLTELEMMVEEGDYYYTLREITQDEIDLFTELLTSYLVELQNSYQGDETEENPFEENVITLKILGNNLQEGMSDVSIKPVGTYHYRDASFSTNESVIEGGLEFTVSGINETEADLFYLTVHNNGYVFHEAFTAQQLLDNEIRTITVDETYVPVEVILPSDNQTELYRQSVNYTLLDSNGDFLSSFYTQVGDKVKEGTYNIQYNGVGEEISYTLIRTDIAISAENQKIEFNPEDMILVNMEFQQNHPYNIEEVIVTPVNFSSNQFNSFYSLNINNNKFYVSNFAYEKVYIRMEIDKDGQQYHIEYQNLNLEFLKTGKLIYNDKAEISLVPVYMNPENSSILEVKASDYIFSYLNVNVVNDLEQKINASKSFNHLTEPEEWLITLKVDDQEYTASVEDYDIGSATLESLFGPGLGYGEATLEFSRPDYFGELAPVTIDLNLTETVNEETE